MPKISKRTPRVSKRKQSSRLSRYRKNVRNVRNRKNTRNVKDVKDVKDVKKVRTVKDIKNDTKKISVKKYKKNPLSGTFSQLSEAEKAKVLEDFDNGNYGDIYTKDSDKDEFSDWSDFDKPNENGFIHLNRIFVIPDSVIITFFDLENKFGVEFKRSGLIYESILNRLKTFTENLCKSIFAKREKVITPKIVMMSMNILPLCNQMIKTVIPFPIFKTVFQTVARDYEYQYEHTIEDDAFHLIQILFERYGREICRYAMIHSMKNNDYIQAFHIISAVMLVDEKYSIVPLSSNPLPSISNETNFKELISQVLQLIHPNHKFSNRALLQLNRLTNALVKELIDISVYMKNQLPKDPKKEAPHRVMIATLNLLPGELAKHAVSEGMRIITNNYTTKLLPFPENVDNLNLLDETSVIFLRAVVEYMLAEISELAGNAANDNQQQVIDVSHIELVLNTDNELYKFMERMKLYFVE